MQKALLVILIIIVGAGAYFLEKNQKSSNQINYTPYFASPITITPNLDETANWRTFRINALGMEFKYPDSLNKYGVLEERNFNVKTELNDTLASGNVVCVGMSPVILLKPAYCQYKEFLISSTSKDFGYPREGINQDLQGFTVVNGKYYTGFLKNMNFEVYPQYIQKITNLNGVEIIKLNIQKLPERTAPEPPPVETLYYPGENSVGAVVNTKNKDFPGFYIKMRLVDGLTEADFERILSTLKFTE